ncbi:uncharacterized protein LOC134747432 [Cydia strobilella]|uniref:uncharacterized protein LOC134747432 n=1 Tax=Cydia strobilella TaxID=1100964 RepID=UPI003005F614
MEGVDQVINESHDIIKTKVNKKEENENNESVTDSPSALESMITELAMESKKAGLTMNKSKTKILTNRKPEDITIENEKIEYVKEYIYLGQIVSFEDSTEKEIQRRISTSWKKYWGHKEIMKNGSINIGIKKKNRIQLGGYPTLFSQEEIESGIPSLPQEADLTAHYSDGRKVSDTIKNTSKAVSFFDELFDSCNGATLNSKEAGGKSLKKAVRAYNYRNNDPTCHSFINLWFSIIKYKKMFEPKEYKEAETTNPLDNTTIECDLEGMQAQVHLVSVQSAKSRWKQLRDSHRDALKRQKTKKSGQSPRKIREWKYQKIMEYLLPYMSNRERDSSLENTILSQKTDDSSSQTSNKSNDDLSLRSEIASQNSNKSNDDLSLRTKIASTSDVSSSSKKKKEDDLSCILNRHLENQENFRKERQELKEFLKPTDHDDIDLFFLSMAKTYKKLPDYLQVPLKRKLFNIISETEESYVMSWYNPNGGYNGGYSTCSGSDTNNMIGRMETPSLQLESELTNNVVGQMETPSESEATSMLPKPTPLGSEKNHFP